MKITEMKNPITMLCAGAALLTLGACDVKDPIYNTLHPGHGTITLTADWSGIGQGLTAPESYTVRAGDYSATVGGGGPPRSTIFSSRASASSMPTTRRSISP